MFCDYLELQMIYQLKNYLIEQEFQYHTLPTLKKESNQSHP